jgi:uncharacterized membrane-anchored protein
VLPLGALEEIAARQYFSHFAIEQSPELMELARRYEFHPLLLSLLAQLATMPTARERLPREARLLSVRNLVEASIGELGLDYCLNPQHPSGRNKARVFASIGIQRAEAEYLRSALLVAAREGEAEPGGATAYGQRYTIDFGLARPKPDCPNPEQLDSTEWRGVAAAHELPRAKLLTPAATHNPGRVSANRRLKGRFLTLQPELDGFRPVSSLSRT